MILSMFRALSRPKAVTQLVVPLNLHRGGGLAYSINVGSKQPVGDSAHSPALSSSGDGDGDSSHLRSIKPLLNLTAVPLIISQARAKRPSPSTMARTEEAKLDLFLQWLQVNGAQFRGCKLKYCDSTKGFGIYSSNGSPKDGVLLVVPLDLAITPMRVLQDPLIGAECRAMFEEGEVDDRFLMILFLTVERLRKNSSWKPYLDMLPTTFGNPLWFTDDEVLELRGTTLYRATELRKKDLISVYEDKVKGLVKKLLVLDGDSEREVCFEDFLWANCIFWSRALNLPLPHSYVFPQIQEDTETPCPVENSSEVTISYSGEHIDEINGKRFEAHEIDSEVNGVTSTSKQEETVWVEGLLPGIDFCNHDLKAVATWEVDGTGSITEVPLSMYLISALQSPLPVDKEISISYGNKGNEELLYLYGFVVDNNPDDYLMIHYPGEAIQNISFSEFKGQLLVAQVCDHE
ncbi:hypothetical protein V6N12_010030 [Hibiscus sabdariffa]|uniref:SET domain-containing protein n=1 Tax=Hibiscus sabdariffa TaxID=183260 RepID=A0ABR2ECH8_9ROSI